MFKMNIWSPRYNHIYCYVPICYMYSHTFLYFVAYCRRAVFKTFNKMYAILSECVRANCAWAFNAFFSFCLFSFFLSAFFTLHSALTRNLTQINENNKNDSQNNNNFNQCVRLRVSVCLSMFLWINALHNLQASVSLCSTYAHRTQGFSI